MYACMCAHRPSLNGQLSLVLSEQHWQGQQFSLSDVEVVTATVNLDAINTYRGGISSLQEQASSAPAYPQIQVGLRSIDAFPSEL